MAHGTCDTVQIPTISRKSQARTDLMQYGSLLDMQRQASKYVCALTGILTSECLAVAGHNLLLRV